jgi:peptidoglycan/LPS O-acetylase OafA/YrhL
MKGLFGTFVTLFESDQRWLVRAISAGACGLIISIGAVWQLRGQISFWELVATFLAVPLFFLMGGGLLATKDSVIERLHSGQNVGRVSYALFAMGMWSLLIWFILVLIVGFPIMVLLGNLAWN